MWVGSPFTKNFWINGCSFWLPYIASEGFQCPLHVQCHFRAWSFKITIGHVSRSLAHFSKKVTVHYRCTTTSKYWPSGLSSSILMQNAKNEPLGLEKLYLWNIFFYFRCCETSLCPPVKYFTDRSKAVLLLCIICAIYVLSRLFIAAFW